MIRLMTLLLDTYRRCDSVAVVAERHNAPSLEAGYHAPIAEGFGRFLRAPQVAADRAEAVKKALQESSTDAYDTHPPMRERIAAMQSMAADKKPQVLEPATTLLDNVDALEIQIIAHVAPQIQTKTLKSVRWEAVGREVYVPIWKRVLNEYASLFAGVEVSSLPETLKKIPDFVSKMRDPPGQLLTREQRVRRAHNLLWMAFALALVNDGWEIQSEPGRFCLTRGFEQLNPIESLNALQSGEKDGKAWREWTESLGIGQLPLGSA
jgi:heat shock protein HtpX